MFGLRVLPKWNHTRQQPYITSPTKPVPVPTSIPKVFYGNNETVRGSTVVVAAMIAINKLDVIFIAELKSLLLCSRGPRVRPPWWFCGTRTTFFRQHESHVMTKITNTFLSAGLLRPTCFAGALFRPLGYHGPGQPSMHQVIEYIYWYYIKMCFTLPTPK